MGDDRSAEGIRRVIDSWEVLLDKHSAYYSDEVEAEEVIAALTVYLRSLSMTKIKTDYKVV